MKSRIGQKLNKANQAPAARVSEKGEDVGEGWGVVKSNGSCWWGNNNHWLRSKRKQQQRCGHRHTDMTTKLLRPP